MGGVYGFQRVIFEIDFKMVIDAPLKDKSNLSKVGSIIASYRNLINLYPNFQVKLIPRDGSLLGKGV